MKISVFKLSLMSSSNIHALTDFECVWENNDGCFAAFDEFYLDLGHQ